MRVLDMWLEGDSIRGRMFGVAILAVCLAGMFSFREEGAIAAI